MAKREKSSKYLTAKLITSFNKNVVDSSERCLKFLFFLRYFLWEYSPNLRRYLLFFLFPLSCYLSPVSMTRTDVFLLTSYVDERRSSTGAYEHGMQPSAAVPAERVHAEGENCWRYSLRKSWLAELISDCLSLFFNRWRSCSHDQRPKVLQVGGSKREEVSAFGHDVGRSVPNYH